MKRHVNRICSRKILKITISCLLSLLTLACFVSSASAVIYGEDDRIDPYAAPSDLQDWIDIAINSTAALIPISLIELGPSDNDLVVIKAPTIQEQYDMCVDELFVSQPAAASCSGVLIDDDLLLTSGQCVKNQSDCAGKSVVFNYRMADETSLYPITGADVFNCQEIVVNEYISPTIDYAIIRLDRPATPRFEPAAVQTEIEAVPEGTGLVVIGHPLGAPTKIEPGGWVRDNREETLDYFVSNSDTFAGNSGSGVWRMDPVEIAGILVRGETDLVNTGSCYIANVCTDYDCRGEDSTYVFHAIEDLCRNQQNAMLCGVQSCDDAIVISPIGGIQSISGDTGESNDNSTPNCVDASWAPDDLYVFTLEAQTEVTASVTGFDTVLYLRRTCYDSASELACNDDIEPGPGVGSLISLTLDPGEYYLIVDGFADSSGPYTLTVTFEDISCSVDSDCDDNLFCNGEETCIDSVCSSGSSPCSVNETCLEDGNECVADSDSDGVPDSSDNCPEFPNADQFDSDADGIGDACDICPNDANNDADGDGVCGDVDNCPEISNPDQEDYDADGTGDVCDDADNDGFTADEDCNDNDPTINPDACDIKNDGTDQDCDGVDRTKGKPCSSSGNEPSAKEGPAQTCSDGIDNDGDGLTDCDDSDCLKKKQCR